MSKTTVRGRKFTVMLHKEGVGGYSAWVLELPGCVSQGGSKQRTITNIKEAIEGYLQASHAITRIPAAVP